MESAATKTYLAAEVMTAPPQKLQLMLIDAAIRSAERARAMWRAGEHEEAGEALVHAQEVIGEMLAGLNQEAAPNLIKKVASVYVFVFRSLVEANLHRDQQKLDDAIRVLRTERDTWRQVCEKLGTEGSTDTPAGGGFSLDA